ncbi:MAG: sigma-70 family RNA polymerase sigma factor [Gemmataceae bacterium]|nr:sigma-70 family RNA polymerase sigma factor [Gemmataceae bacterium]
MRAAVEAVARLTAGPDDRPDGDLVAAFVGHADGPAFAALVRRHGPMVYRVCLRVAGNAHDAEDAAQAAFLALARHARSIRRRQSVAAWLHGVAVRVARKARDRSIRQHRREQAAARPERVAAADPSWAEVRGVLDDELARLPDRLRQPLVLCYLQGRTRDEAAKALGWSPATLGRRLEAARDALGRRLRARGVAGAAALPAVLVSDAATGGAFPPVLTAACVDHALAAAGRTGKPIPPAVAELSRGVTQTMSRSVLVVGVAAGVLAAGLAAGLGQPPGGVPRPAGPPVVTKADAPKKAAEEPKVFSPEQLEKDRPKGKVTVRFRVEEVGLIVGGLNPEGAPPYPPISLETVAGLKDRRSKCYAMLVMAALDHVHRVGVGDPAKHFRGRTVEVTGTVDYLTLPRITRPDGSVEVPEDNYPQYQVVITDLKQFRVVE